MDKRIAGEENNHQDTLREYQEKYRILNEMMPMGAFRLGPAPEYRIVSANRIFPRILGFDSGDAIEGIPVRDLIIDPAHWQQIETDLMRDGSVTRRELQMKHKEGSGILVALNTRVVADSDVPVAWIDGVAEDVTERKVLEMEMQYHEAEVNRYALALIRANEKLNLLSSITRHDILNQLTALSGYLELMSEGPLTPQTQKYIEIEKRIAQTIKTDPVYQGLSRHWRPFSPMVLCKKNHRDGNGTASPPQWHTFDRYRKYQYLCRSVA